MIYAVTWLVIISGFVGAEDWRRRASSPEFDIQLSSWWNFLDCIPYLLVYTLFRQLYNSLFKESIYSLLYKNDQANFELKQHKVVKEGWSVIFYTFSSVTAYILFADSNLLSTYLLGTSNCEQMVTSWTEISVTPQLRFFFMLALSHHMYSLLSFLKRSWNVHVPEFNETFLHHVITVAMIMLCYLCGFFPFGLTVLICSDVSDIVLAFCKFTRDMGIGRRFQLSDFAFGFLVVVWIYLRVFVMTCCVLFGCGKASYMMASNKLDFFNHTSRQFFREKYIYYYQVKVFLILLLCLLNLYWSFLILKIAYNRVINKDIKFAITSHGEKMNNSPAASKPLAKEK